MRARGHSAGRGRGWLAGASLLALTLVLATGSMASSSTFPDAPEFIPPVATEPPPGTRVEVSASRLTYDGKAKVATATGAVHITYGPYTLTASKVVYDMKKGVFRANGSVVLREPNGNMVEADMAEVEERFKEGFARHVTALLTNDVTITAQYARRYENGITVFEQASYTACVDCADEDGGPLWRIVAEKVTHDQEARTLYYDDPTLEIAGVPVLWAPYFAYPDPSVKRRSGFLFPRFDRGNAYGYGAAIPYFWAVKPNADVTFTPRLTTKQGLVGDAEWRHRLRDGIYSLRGYGVYQLDPQATDDQSRARGAIASKGDFRINNAWTWGWDGTLVSDRSFDNEYDYSLGDQGMIANRAHVTGLWGRNYAWAQALQFRTLLTDESQDQLPVALPYLNTNYIFEQEVLGGELGFDFNAYSITRKAADDDLGLGTEQTRAVADVQWQRQMIVTNGLVITPQARMRSDIYVSENVPEADDPSRTAAHLLPTAGVDMRWPLVAEHGFAQSVLTPVFQAFAAAGEPDDANQGNEDAITLNFDHANLFLSDRFTGYDRFEGGTRVNAGVVYNLLLSNGGFLRASAGESFHVAGENSFVSGSGLDGTASDLVGAIAFQPNDTFRFTYQARAEENLSRINVQEASLGLTFDRISGSFNYAFARKAEAYGRPDDEQQVWGGANYQLTEAWDLFGGLRYDLEDDAFMEKTFGVAFGCDCMAARLAYSETRDDGNGADRRVELSVELRTLGEVSGSFGF